MCWILSILQLRAWQDFHLFSVAQKVNSVIFHLLTFFVVASTNTINKFLKFKPFLQDFINNFSDAQAKNAVFTKSTLKTNAVEISRRITEAGLHPEDKLSYVPKLFASGPNLLAIFVHDGLSVYIKFDGPWKFKVECTECIGKEFDMDLFHCIHGWTALNIAIKVNFAVKIFSVLTISTAADINTLHDERRCCFFGWL